MLEINKVDNLDSESTRTFYKDIKEGEGFTLATDKRLRIKLEKGHIFETSSKKFDVYRFYWPDNKEVIRADVQINWCIHK